MNTLELQDALSVLNETIDTEPNRAELHFQAGNIQKKLGNLKAAAMAYARAIELESDYIAAYNNLGIVLYELGEKNKALNIFRQGIALQGDNSLLQHNYQAAQEGVQAGGDNPETKMIPAEDDATSPGGPESQSAPAVSGVPENRAALPPDLIGLMYYLRDLSGELTGKSRENFARSDARLGLEYIINTLEGRKGLLHDIRDQFSPEQSLGAEPAREKSNPKNLTDTLNYLRNLAAALPDPDLGAAINRKVNRVIRELQQTPREGENGDIHGQ
ncbi:MAG: tetratricopeptide repeat protein [Treponema sp.]|jgi:tetratricopeptide (TPR) repeat protein|nr:tetratricopeptide repeat protein [Treponema sp.]